MGGQQTLSTVVSARYRRTSHRLRREFHGNFSGSQMIDEGPDC